MYFIKKSWFSELLVIFLFLLTIVPSNAFAQVVDNSKSTEIVNQNTSLITVNINNVAFSEEREIYIDFIAENKSDVFLDNLQYSFEFYQGDKLEKTGLIFRNLDYVVSTTDSLERIAPKEKVRKTIKYKMPESIPGGPYFIRGVVFNEEASVYGVGYTTEPIRLTGLGGFISEKSSALVDINNKKVYQLMAGPTLEKDGNYLIAFPADINTNLFKYLENNEILADIKISHLSDRNKIVYEKSNIPLSKQIRQDKLALEIKVEPWENMLSGPHTMLINYKNEKGEQISETTKVRLLYRGLIGRVYNVETNINSYKRGEPINLDVNVIVAGDETAKLANLKVEFKNKGQLVQEENKSIELEPTFEGTDTIINFNDKKIKYKTIIDEIKITLTSENGTVLDENTITMDTSKEYTYPKDSNWLMNTLIAIILLVVVLVIWAIIKNKFNLHLASVLIAFILITGAYLSSGEHSVFAQDYNWDDYYGQRGCTDPRASNYNPNATVNDGSCLYFEVSGCTMIQSPDYNSSATTNDGSCRGCGDPRALNYWEGYDIRDDSTCYYDDPDAVYGCMDRTASNYNSAANRDDGSCRYDEKVGCMVDHFGISNYDPEAKLPGDCEGCTDREAINYHPSAVREPPYDFCYYDDCMDPTASNYNRLARIQTDPDACDYRQYPGCTDELASNYDPTATYDDGTCYYKPGCTDKLAKNFDPAAKAGDNSCIYDDEGCTDKLASNYNPRATKDDGSCIYGVPGCTDPSAINYNPLATIRDQSCKWRKTLLDLWSNDAKSGNQGECNDDPIDSSWFVKVKCSQCGNLGESLTVDYFNNGYNSSQHNQSHTIYFSSPGNMLNSYRLYIIAANEKLNPKYVFSNELKKAEENNLAGTPINNASDVINEWIIGPFVFPFYFEEKNSCTEEVQEHKQQYIVRASTTFDGDFCRADGPSIITVVKDISCDIKPCKSSVRSSFFIDNNEDGVPGGGENYLKSDNAPSNCSGQSGAPLGVVDGKEKGYFSALESNDCNSESIAEFVQNELEPGDYRATIDPSNSFGWIQTGIQYLIEGSGWQSRSKTDYLPLESNKILKSRIGLKLDTRYPVVLSCEASPNYSRNTNKTVNWKLSGFYSDKFDLNDLELVWTDPDGIMEPPTRDRPGSQYCDSPSSCSTLSPRSSILGGNFWYEYPRINSRNKPNLYNMNVFARYNGEQVSQEVSCRSIQINEMNASCNAYSKFDDIATGQIIQSVNPDEEVWWSVNVDGAIGTPTYKWTGDGLFTTKKYQNKNIGPFRYKDKKKTKTVRVEVTDIDGATAENNCSVFVRECTTNEECPNKECQLTSGLCVDLRPLFETDLFLDPGLINEGEKCGLSWSANESTKCTLYKNGEIIDENAPISANGMLVEIGTYLVTCTNDDPNVAPVSSGPVRCLLNPDIREQ